MWEKVFYGNTTKDWAISFGIIIAAVLLNKLLQLLNKKVFQKLASKTNNKYDDILLSSLETPILWGIMLFAIWIALYRLNTPTNVYELIGQAYRILTVLNVTWFFARLLTSLLEERTRRSTSDIKSKKSIDKKFFPLIKRTVLIVVWLIGGVMALSNVGISVTALLGTLGIGGVAIALGAQDTVKNVLGGITIFTDKVFGIGDTVNISGVEGTVEDIGLRSTRIRTYERQLVTIPNYKVGDASIVNITKEPKRRVMLKLNLVYDTTPEQMKKAIQILLSIPARIPELDQKDFSAVFSDFADSALVINYIYNIRKGFDIRETNSKVNFEILSEFNKEGLVFALPSKSVVIENKGDNNLQGGIKEITV